MRFKLIVLSFLLLGSFCWSQKLSREERRNLREYYFDADFTLPSTKKLSTLILEDGTEVKGYVDKIDFTHRNLINEITFKDQETEVLTTYPASQLKEAYLFGSQLDKIANVGGIISRGGTAKRNNMDKATEDGAINFVKKPVVLRSKSGEEEVLFQLINPGFSDYIAVYNDPGADESRGASVSGGLASMNLGGGTVLSYFVEKNGEVFLLTRRSFKKEFEKLFGDHPEFMKKYPLKQVKWDWLSGLILEYTKMRSGE